MQLQGVNLGGWLILEKWITPSLFNGFEAKDEYSFCLEKPEEAQLKLQHHRETFITKQDFEWLVKHGINAVRIPIGYWALQSDAPFVTCATYLDQAFEWAKECHVKVVLDLHGAPGSQNGQDHSGKAGSTKWRRRSNVEYTLQTIKEICERYGRHPALWGIELLNEPGWKIQRRILRDYYDEGYDTVRQYCDEQVAVVISDAFKPLTWNKFLGNSKYRNIVLDTHLYQCFSPLDTALSLQGHLDKTQNDWGELFSKINQPVIVGEWSLGLDPKTFRGLDGQQQREATSTYAQAQLDAFEKARGWFFWNYKTENMRGWSFRDCIETGQININPRAK